MLRLPPVATRANSLFPYTPLLRSPSADARRFSARIAMTEHHVVDALWVDPAAFHERLEDRGAEFAGGEGRKPASELADRGAERRDDRGAAQLHGDKLLLFGCLDREGTRLNSSH